MATCIKCGKSKLAKRPDGLRWCKRCGAVPGVVRACRSGFAVVDQLGRLVKLDNGSTITFMGLK